MLLIGFPVPFAFLGTVVYLVYSLGYDPSFLLPFGYAQLNTIVLLALPLFVISGNIMNEGRIGDKIIDFVNLFAGRIKGGLGVVACFACGIFGSITGSSLATLSCIGGLMAPKFAQAKYPAGYTAALLSSASMLGLLIPPSPVMILYAFVAR